jgi:5'-nucleotidase
MENGMGDQEVIAKSRYIDIVLGGHSHTYFEELRYVKNLDGKDIQVDQNGKHGIFIGKMELTLE